MEHIRSLPSGGNYPWRIPSSAVRTAIVRRASDGAIFATTSSGCRRHVRTWETYLRLRELGRPVVGWTLADSEISGLPSCSAHANLLSRGSVRGDVVRATDGTAYYVGDGNVGQRDIWYWIDSGAKYNHLVNRFGYQGTYTWGEINSIRIENGHWAGWW